MITIFQSNLWKKAMFCLPAMCLINAAWAAEISGPSDQSIQWKKHVLNAESKFEAAGVGDINNDGQKDIMCGDSWYEAPDWTRRRVCDIREQNQYHDDFANLMQDVDGDGDLDVVSVTYFSQEILWRENPGKTGVDWTVHIIDKPGNCETAFFFDMNGDGVMDILPNVGQIYVWYEKVPAKPTWTKHVVGKEGAGHGGGAGDVNGDGLLDFIGPKGWYETSKTGDQFTYTWHPEFTLENPSVPMLVQDVNGDGLNDIIYGLGHNYGMYWLEQQKNKDKRTWTPHLIEKTWSQPHALFFVDLDGNGKLELVTGKRYHAHNGNDPGGNDPRCIYYYKYDKETDVWQRHIIEENGSAGFGLMPEIADVDDDGDLDIVCPGKSGLYLFEQIR